MINLLPYSTEQERRLLIVEDKTRTDLGINVSILGPTSNKMVYVRCIVCGNIYLNTFGGVVRKMKGLTCSKECRKVLRSIKATERMDNESVETKNKRVQAHQHLYSDSVKVQKIIKERQEKSLATKGYKHHMHCIEQRERASQSFKEDGRQQKIIATNREKFGTDYPFQSPVILEKVKQSNIEKYGTDKPGSLPSCRKKAQQTCLDKYGVENIFESEGFSDKVKQIWLHKYGVEHPNQLPERCNRLKEWCIQNPEKQFASRSEIEMLQWTKQYYPGAQKHKDGECEIDVFIPEINLGIEHNGLYWHQESIVGKKYHIDKTKHFEEKGIRIIHIFEHEWKLRKEQVKSFLLSAIGKNEHKIGARKCNLLWSSLPIDIQEVHNFLETYHIQGQPGNTQYVIKVLYNNELLAVATFGKHHRNNKDWVLTRFCTKTNYTIQGVLSRVSKLASQQLKEDILSWADYRLSNGNGYEKAGWVFEKMLPPDYFYHKHGVKVVSKQSRQKRIVKTPQGVTESEHAKVDGLNRVYDCGKMRYRYRYVRL